MSASLCDAGHEVHEHQRVQRPEPQRLGRVDPVQERQPRQVEGEQRHAGQRHQPERERGEHRLRRRRSVATPRSSMRNSGPYGVGVSLHIGSTPSWNQPGIDGDTRRVRVEAGGDELALREVGVDVAAEQRSGEQQRARTRPPARDPHRGTSRCRPASTSSPSTSQACSSRATADDDQARATSRPGGAGAQRVDEGQRRPASVRSGSQPTPQGAERDQERRPATPGTT